jgi:hypothetical protein
MPALLPDLALDRRPDEADDAGRDHADGVDEALDLDLPRCAGAVT